MDRIVSLLAGGEASSRRHDGPTGPYLTMMVPLIFGWNTQKYLKVPAVSKTWLKLSPG
jgi:hypothetical protein